MADPLASASKHIGKYEFLTELGRGSYGVVYRVRSLDDGHIYVCKILPVGELDSKARQEARNEVKVLATFNSPYIVKYREAFIKQNKLHIIMEFAEKGTLHGRLKNQHGRLLSEDCVWTFFLQIACGLFDMHSRRILHRDLKTLNVFLDRDENVKIGDMGVAKLMSSNTNFAKTLVGTPYYLSPELCEDKPYNDRSDVWALGCILYELCTLKHPFDAANQGALIVKIISGKYPPISNVYSAPIHDILKACLQRDMMRRPSVKDILTMNECKVKASRLGVIMPVGFGLSPQIHQTSSTPIPTPVPTVTKSPSRPVSRASPKPVTKPLARAALAPIRPSNMGPSKSSVPSPIPQDLEPFKAQVQMESNYSNKFAKRKSSTPVVTAMAMGMGGTGGGTGPKAPTTRPQTARRRPSANPNKPSVRDLQKLQDMKLVANLPGDDDDGDDLQNGETEVVFIDAKPDTPSSSGPSLPPIRSSKSIKCDTLMGITGTNVLEPQSNVPEENDDDSDDDDDENSEPLHREASHSDVSHNMILDNCDDDDLILSVTKKSDDDLIVPLPDDQADDVIVSVRPVVDVSLLRSRAEYLNNKAIEIRNVCIDTLGKSKFEELYDDICMRANGDNDELMNDEFDAATVGRLFQLLYLETELKSVFEELDTMGIR